MIFITILVARRCAASIVAFLSRHAQATRVQHSADSPQFLVLVLDDVAEELALDGDKSDQGSADDEAKISFS